MKNILTLLLICSVFSLQAQIVAYDYEAKTYVSYDPATGAATPVAGNPVLNSGANVSYWLVNINPWAQKVEIKGKLFTVTTNMPAQLATLFDIKVEAQKELDNTQKQVAKMEDLKGSVSPVAGTLKAEMQQLVTNCNDYYEKANKINDAIALHDRLTQTMADKSFYNAPVMSRALAVRHVDSPSIASLNVDFANFETAYKTVFKQYQAAIDAARAANEKDKEARIVSAKEQVEKDYEALEKQYKKTLFSIDDLFDKAINFKSYVVKSESLKLAGDTDEVEFTTKIGDSSGPPDVLLVQGGWKVDFSVGPVVNFVSNEAYFFDATNNTLQRRNKSQFCSAITPTVASMMHVYRRTSKDVAWGGMFGVNAGFKELTDLNLGFVAGVSTILRSSPIVVISTGLSYQKVNRLKEGEYKVGNAYKDVKIEAVTEQLWKPSWFVAVSLNLAKRKAKKPASE
jgi:hypothetical protein